MVVEIASSDFVRLAMTEGNEQGDSRRPVFVIGEILFIETESGSG
jgi:hypothetical protein